MYFETPHQVQIRLQVQIPTILKRLRPQTTKNERETA
jgi:hypothetical protein